VSQWEVTNGFNLVKSPGEPEERHEVGEKVELNDKDAVALYGLGAVTPLDKRARALAGANAPAEGTPTVPDAEEDGVTPDA